jgi:hypothetical protein
MKNRPLPFTAITPEWIKGFTNYLFGEVSNNTTRLYLMDIFAGLEDAVRQDILLKNPFRLIPRNERVKQHDTYRHAFSIPQLQHLVELVFSKTNQPNRAH